MPVMLAICVPLYACAAIVVIRRCRVRSPWSWLLLAAFIGCGVLISGRHTRFSGDDQFLVATTGRSYAIVPHALDAGARVYVDRTYEIDSLPEHLRGATYIRTANDDRECTAAAIMHLPLRAGTTIFVAYAAYDTVRPAWLRSFSPTRETLHVDIQHFVLFRRTVPHDTELVLGGNAVRGSTVGDNRRAKYFVILDDELRQTPRAPYVTVRDTANAAAEVSVATGADGSDSVRGVLVTALRNHAAWLAGGRHDIDLRFSVRDATLDSLVLENVRLRYADFVAATLHHARISASDLSHIQCEHARFTGGSELICCDLTGANFDNADLRHVDFSGSKLDRANLTGALLDSADFTGADLDGVVFEPETLPDVRGLARASNLSGMRFASYPGALVELRAKLDELGYDDQKHQVTAAIERERTDRAATGERLLRVAFFGFTCDYGMSIWKPLFLLARLLGFMFPLYLILALARPSSLLVTRKETVEVSVSSETEGETDVDAEIEGDASASAIDRGGAVRAIVRVAVFTVVSAFSIGRDEINIAAWVLRVLPHEVRFRARGAIRVLSGVHAILSFYLFILWVLLYLKNPFE